MSSAPNRAERRRTAKAAGKARIERARPNIAAESRDDAAWFDERWYAGPHLATDRNRSDIDKEQIRQQGVIDMSVANTPLVLPSAPMGLGLGDYEIDARYAPGLGLNFLLENIGPTTLCAIHPHTRGVRGCWLDESTIDNATAWINQFNATAGFNVYFALNEPHFGLCKKPSKAQIIGLRAIPADVDAKQGRSMDEAFAAIGFARVVPSFIIATGGGFQPIWMLTEPLAATEENIQRAEGLGARIVQLTGSDPVQNIDRILRMPFTKNFPNKKKAEAGRVVCCSGLAIPKAGGTDEQPKFALGTME